MVKGYELVNGTIIIKRDLTELDMFVKKFLDVLKIHSDYLIVSGFVSISTGRTRGTEDIDIIVPIMDKQSFLQLFQKLEKNGFWCYQTDLGEVAYDHVKNSESIRFALKDKIFPNMEFISFGKNNKAKYFEFTHPQNIKIKDFEFKIPQIEFEILYKELILKSKKDFEDAKHLRVFFSDIILEKKFKEYLPIIKGELR